MVSIEKQPDWNELQFLSWDEFMQMAPAIVLLEVRRIDRLLEKRGDLDLDCRNRLVKARFEMRQFVDSLPGASPDSVRQTGASYLRHAALNMSMEDLSLDQDMRHSCDYIANRLDSVLKRIVLIY